jgi:hypothetical protein
MIAFASAEPGGAMVEELLADRRNQCFAHAVNLCEVYYDACRRIGAEAASQLISDLAGSGVRFRFRYGLGVLATCGPVEGRCPAYFIGGLLWTGALGSA